MRTRVREMPKKVHPYNETSVKISTIVLLVVICIILLGFSSNAFATTQLWEINWQKILLEENATLNKTQPAPEKFYIDSTNQLVAYRNWSDFSLQDDYRVTDQYVVGADDVSYNQFEKLQIISPTTDGGFLTEDREWQKPEGVTAGRVVGEILLRKLDRNRNEQFTVAITSDLGVPMPSSAITNAISAYVEVSDGYLLVGPETTHQRAHNQDINVLVHKIDKQGRAVAEKVIETEVSTWIRTGIRLKDGSVLLLPSGDSSGTDGSKWQYLLKVDKDGNKLVEVTLPGMSAVDGVSDERLVTETKDGSILFVYRSREEGVGQNNVLVKLDDKLNIVWQKSYPVVGSDSAYHYIVGVTELEDGRIMMFGRHWLARGASGGNEIQGLIMTADSQGNLLDISLLNATGQDNKRALISDLKQHDGQIWFLGDANTQNIYAKPWFGTVSSVSSALTPVPTPAPTPATPQASAPSAWAVTEINAAKSYGLTTDKVLSNYQTSITREEFCELAVKLYEAISGKQAQTAAMTTFTDTTNPEILKAYQLGIVAGVGDGKFAPNNNVTREQIALMFYRTMNVAKPNSKAPQQAAPNFTDANQIANWAREAVTDMSARGIITGMGDGRFAPQGNATREQGIALVKRVYEAIN